jgi:hypothetical protein
MQFLGTIIGLKSPEPQITPEPKSLLPKPFLRLFLKVTVLYAKVRFKAPQVPFATLFG